MASPPTCSSSSSARSQAKKASALNTYAVMKYGGGIELGARIDTGRGDLGGQGAPPPPPVATSTTTLQLKRKEATRRWKPEEHYPGKKIKDRKVEDLGKIAQTEFAAAIVD